MAVEKENSLGKIPGEEKDEEVKKTLKADGEVKAEGEESSEVTEETEDEKEESYQRSVSLMSSLKCMTPCNSRTEMYQQLAKQFQEMSGYKDTKELAKKCRGLAKKSKDEIHKVMYEEAKRKKALAKSSEDYRSLAEEFLKIQDYEDAKELALECSQQSQRLEQKDGWRRWVNYVLVLAGIVIVIAGSRTAHAKYYLANLYGTVGSYNSAIKAYTKLGGYKDSKERLISCQYKNGLALNEKGEFNKAVKAFDAAGDYKDSEKKMVEAEKQAIKTGKAGDMVQIGSNKWKIMDKEDDKALLMKKASLLKTAYHNASGDVTWEQSELRQWLNSDFLKKNFSKIEQANILLSDVTNSGNSVYGTKGGNDTKDYVFILSAEEVKQYGSLTKSFQSNSWLRTPGSVQSSAAFRLGNGTVMDYGYVATSKDLAVYPVLWFHTAE